MRSPKPVTRLRHMGNVALLTSCNRYAGVPRLREKKEVLLQQLCVTAGDKWNAMLPGKLEDVSSWMLGARRQSRCSSVGRALV